MRVTAPSLFTSIWTDYTNTWLGNCSENVFNSHCMTMCLCNVYVLSQQTSRNASLCIITVNSLKDLVTISQTVYLVKLLCLEGLMFTFPVYNVRLLHDYSLHIPGMYIWSLFTLITEFLSDYNDTNLQCWSLSRTDTTYHFALYCGAMKTTVANLIKLYVSSF